MQQQETLQQKQAYLRTNIDQDLYQQFYSYCQSIVGSVDINSWTMGQVREIVSKFNRSVEEKNRSEDGAKMKYSYNQYQSRHDEPAKISSTGAGSGSGKAYEDQYEPSECKSSKIVKSSAVQLLDEILEEQQHSKMHTQGQGQAGKRNSSQMVNPFPTNSPQTSKTVKNQSAVSFEQFDFWTSNITTPSLPKNQPEIRNKSSSQFRPTSITNKMNTISPQTTKNSYNIGGMGMMPDYGLGIGGMGTGINANSNANTNMNINISISQPPTRGRFQTQQMKSSDFDIFLMGAQDQSKKNSPYMRKQAPHQAYQLGSKHEIKLKQVRQLPERGMSVHIDKSRTSPSQAPFQDTINCYKSAVRNQLADRSLNIFIDKHEIIERKFLAADYAMYNVKVQPLGIELKRNYEDFSKLRLNLGKIFPGIHLPYLEETSWLSGTNLDFINNQKKMLELFTRDLLRNKQFRNSRLMEDFMTLKDHKTIKRKYEKYQDIQPLKGLEQLCLLEGKVHITLSPQQKTYIENFQKFLQKMNQLFQRHQKLTQTLIEQYSQIMRTYKSLIVLMEEMEKSIKEFNVKVTTNTIKYLGNSVRLLRETYKEEFSNVKFDYEVNLKKVLPFLKYERKNFMQLTKLIQTEHKLKKAFDKRFLSQKIGIGENYMSQNVKGTKKSILDESDSLIVLKYQVGYFGYQCRNEGQRIFDELAVKTVARWQSLGASYLDKLTSSVGYWQGVTKIDRDKYHTELTF